MGTYDISRINFEPKKHYSSVRMQQGRVLTDDDWNEERRIAENELHQSNIDIIGPFGSPDAGFRIDSLRDDSGLINFEIHSGTLYLGGLKLDLEKPETFRLQKDWLQLGTNIAKTPSFNGKEQFDLIYIEAWQQAVSAVEDSSLFEVALGGPDTTTRLRNMRRVKIAEDIGFCQCVDAWNQFNKNLQSHNFGIITPNHELFRNTKLKVTFSNTGLPEDLCTPTAAGGYLGAENQAIRVQIVNKNHLTWGFDNGAPLYRVAVSADGKTITMLTEPKDQYHWPLSNQIIEILPWSAVLSNGEKVAELSGHLSKVDASYNPDSGILTMQNALPASFGDNWKTRDDKSDLVSQTPPEYFYMRVWNRGSDLASDPEITFTTDVPLALGNTGLEITISGDDRMKDDYWVIAARPETPNKVVPWNLENGIAPHGVKRFYAPLAIIRWTKDAQGNVSGEIFHDCRKKFHPLTAQDCCCTFTVGDGKNSHGDFDSIQEAIDQLPLNGGKICVLPGVHHASVKIQNRKQIRITGCGDQSIVLPEKIGERLASSIFTIISSQHIQIDQLCMYTTQGIAVRVMDHSKTNITSQHITIKENRIIAGVTAIYIHLREDLGHDNHIQILYNQIGILDSAKGRVAIFSLADKVLIERNRIVVIPEPNAEDPNDPRDPDDPNNGDPFDPCKDLDKIVRDGFSIQFIVYNLIKYVSIYFPHVIIEKKYLALGGIQIGATSERVIILENEIIGGAGNGITLGHHHSSSNETISSNTVLMVSDHQEVRSKYAPLYEIAIEGNKIITMGLSGISTLMVDDDAISYVMLDDLTIYRNLIRNCAFQLPNLKNKNKELDKDWAFGGVVLNDCENGRIQENRIEENGLISGAPICGVFIFTGEEIDLSNNSIINNGIPVMDDDTETVKGNRGGIVVKMTFKPAQLKKIIEAEVPSFDGVPSIKVHDNIVSQPHGFALFLIAFGPVSVVSNQFTSYGTDKKNVFSILASSVMIFNLGVSKDLFVIMFKNMANSATDYAKLSSNANFQQILKVMQYLPNGKVMFSSNQTTLDMRFPSRNLSLASQMIMSLDDIAFNSNQSECAGFLSLLKDSITFDMVLMNTVLFGISVRSNDNRFTDGVTLTIYSLVSWGYMMTATGNQSTHCLLTMGTLTAVNSNLVLDNTLCKDKV